MSDAEKTLKAMEGVGRLAVQRQVEEENLSNAIQRTIDVFNSYPDGIREMELAQLVKKEGFERSHVGAGLDVLRSRGLAIKNWTTGFLSHVPNQGM